MLQKNRDAHFAIGYRQDRPAVPPIFWNRRLKWLVPILLGIGVLLP